MIHLLHKTRRIVVPFGIILVVSTGCAQDPPPVPVVPVQPVTIKAESFCLVMRRVLPSSKGYPVWDITDSRETIDSARRLEAAFKRRCAQKTVANS